jgi:anti-anti-sigma factor
VSLVITHERLENVPVLDLAGELDIYTVDAFRRAAEPVREHEAVIVDMGKVDLVDSSGLGALSRCARQPLGGAR